MERVARLSLLLTATLAAAAGLAACDAPTVGIPPEASGHAPARADGLTVTVATPERIAGTYRRADAAIAFDVGRIGEQGHLLLATVSGEPLLELETLGTASTARVLGGRLVATWDDLGGASDVADDDGVVLTGERDAFVELMARPEYALLPWLSHDLAARGLGGPEAPASLALHQAALGVAQSLRIDVPTTDVTSGRTASGGGCADLRSNPRHDGCFGMCGPGCSCWHWVCGDCCSHAGCRHHDAHCRRCDWDHPGDCLHCAIFHIPGGCGR